ncbi:hypothetical protein DYB25_010667 [Aphanomyces astaci]|uniref:PHD-type domain-containing protein n=1 Tax=Aphanomyces astaci TaxID=112090 RepID=A0A397ADU3_APHAT|nr:hypothetical protein DYB25_010667 [Aphanomyces astaci]
MFSSAGEVRTIPLPSSSRRTGPILAYPPHPFVRELLQQIGTPVMVNEEKEVTTLVEEQASRDYVSSFFQSLADAGMISHEPFQDMAEEAATPGGLNEQTHRGLVASGAYELLLDEVETDVACAVCKKKGTFEQRIVCDGKDCEREYHMTCLKPPLVEVPSGEWFCPLCNLSRVASAFKRTPTNGSSFLQRGPSAVCPNEIPLPSPTVDESVQATPVASTSTRRDRKPTTDAKLRRDSRGRGEEQPARPPPTVDLASEERCFLCGLGGELVVCEFPRCTKVYHQLCLGAFPFPTDEDTEWVCPRHSCVLSGRKEPPVQTSTKSIWHCLHCPVAVDDTVLPSHPALSKISRREKTMVCPHCNAPSPKVRLAKILERIWSVIATNRQGMPFCGPLLVGIDRPADMDPHLLPLDLFQIIALVRNLRYSSEDAFVRDIHTVVETALVILKDQSAPLVEAAKTMSIVVREQMQYHQAQFQSIQTLMKHFYDGNANQKVDDPSTWNIAWRKECMPFGDKSYVHIEARSIDEWTSYVANATLYANLTPRAQPEGIEDRLPRPDTPPPPPLPRMTKEVSTEAAPVATDHSAAPASIDQRKSLTLSDGIDVLVALSDLGNQQQPRYQAPTTTTSSIAQSGEAAEPSIYREELGLTPSICEMDAMFQQQASLLRKALSAHATLEHAWNISKQHMLGMRQDQVISIGEGRLAAELRMANNNLKARLRNKDQMLQQLTSDHLDLNGQVKQLQCALDEKEHLQGEVDPSKRSNDAKFSAGDDDDHGSSPIEKRARLEDDSPAIKRGRGRPPKKRPSFH